MPKMPDPDAINRSEYDSSRQMIDDEDDEDSEMEKLPLFDDEDDDE